MANVKVTLKDGSVKEVAAGSSKRFVAETWQTGAFGCGRRCE